ncbi:MAG: hypothetical protein JWM98_2584 [Thermoleophilia bacterium]|nr:hypothetical protein [Thermoleophilia bacterium]
MQTSIASSTAAFKHHHGADGTRGNGGVQGFFGDLLRSGGAGYQAATHASGVEVDKASIYPFETIMTGTGLLKEKTSHIKGVSKATSLLNTIAGFGTLIVTSNVSGTTRAPGDTASDLANHVADMIDGKKTAQGWSLGWGMKTDAATGEQHLTESGVGSALGSLGMR